MLGPQYSAVSIGVGVDDGIFLHRCCLFAIWYPYLMSREPVFTRFYLSLRVLSL